MNGTYMDAPKLSVQNTNEAKYADGKVVSRRSTKLRITQGQLEALSARFHEEFDSSFQRAGTGVTATVDENVLTIVVHHSLAAAEHNLMRRTSGREFFQRYVEELAEQMYPTFVRHIEGILPCTVTYSNVKVDCENDSTAFSFGMRPKMCWSAAIAEANHYREHYA